MKLPRSKAYLLKMTLDIFIIAAIVIKLVILGMGLKVAVHLLSQSV